MGLGGGADHETRSGQGQHKQRSGKRVVRCPGSLDLQLAPGTQEPLSSCGRHESPACIPRSPVVPHLHPRPSCFGGGGGRVLCKPQGSRIPTLPPVLQVPGLPHPSVHSSPSVPGVGGSHSGGAPQWAPGVWGRGGPRGQRVWAGEGHMPTQRRQWLSVQASPRHTVGCCSQTAPQGGIPTASLPC